nr:MAG TPA: hypothetical protein [Caudoviricetes sp.]
MALTVKQLIDKLYMVEDKNKDVYFETPISFVSIDRVFIDEEGEIILNNVAESAHCECDNCNENVIEL